MSRGTTGCRPLLLPSISFGSSWTVKEWPALCVHTSAPPQAWRCRARLSPTRAPGADTPRVCLWRFCCCLFVSGRPCRTKSQVKAGEEPARRLSAPSPDLHNLGCRLAFVPQSISQLALTSAQTSPWAPLCQPGPAAPCLEAWLASILGGRPRALPSPAALPREGLLAGLRFDPLAALSDWLALPTSWQGWGAGGSVLQECGDLRLHAKRLPRPQFSLSYLGPVSPRYRGLHFMPLRALTLILSWSFQSLAQWRQFHIYVLG